MDNYRITRRSLLEALGVGVVAATNLIFPGFAKGQEMSRDLSQVPQASNKDFPRDKPNRQEIFTRRAQTLLDNFIKNNPVYRCMGLTADARYFFDERNKPIYTVELFKGSNYPEREGFGFEIELDPITIDENVFAQKFKEAVTDSKLHELCPNLIV